MRIMLIEDDTDICNAIQAQLVREGYQTDICQNGEDALFYIEAQVYDAIILDRLLPGMDGLELLRSIRQQGIQTPVILATAMSSVSDRIDGLDTGADDYIVKPFAIEELTARIRALTRRPVVLENTNELTYQDLRLNVPERTLFCNESQNQLSKRETLLAEYFLRNPEQTLAREQIFSYVWGPDTEVENGNLDNYVHFLRKRLASLKSIVRIKTIHGSGYRLEA